MSEPLGACHLMVLAVEGATDAIFGRPRSRSPYRPRSAEWEAWTLGHDVACELLELYGSQECARWLEAA